MDKSDKKKHKIEARINELEKFLSMSLGKKTSSTREVDVPKIFREIADLKAKLAQV